MSLWTLVEGLFNLWQCAKVGGWNVASHDIKHLIPVTITKNSTLGLQMHQSLTSFVFWPARRMQSHRGARWECWM
jgi:hypothetical protein